MGSPSGRVPERAPERFLVATEACGGGTPDLSLSSMFLGYMGIYRRKKLVGGASRENSSLPGMDSAGMMKMATDDGIPPRQGGGTGS